MKAVLFWCCFCGGLLLAVLLLHSKPGLCVSLAMLAGTLALIYRICRA